jgi:hypothetical protein
MFTCDQCGKEAPDEEKQRIYRKVLCSDECVKEAGKTYQPIASGGGGGW